MSGAFFCPSDAWDRVVLAERERLGPSVRLSDDWMAIDVAHLIDRALRPADPVDFPTFAELRARWGIEATSTLSRIVNAPSFCRDARKAAAWADYWRDLTARRARGANRAERARNGRGTGAERAWNGRGRANAEDSENPERARNGRGTGAERARNVVGALVLEHPAPSTQHHEDTPCSPPAGDVRPDDPPVDPDAPLNPEGPDHLPEQLHAASVAAPRPEGAEPSGPPAALGTREVPSPKKRGSKPKGPQVDPVAWEALLGAVAELDPAAARRIDAGRSEALAEQLRKLVAAVGPERAVRRLRYVARWSTDSGPTWWREHGADLAMLVRVGSALTGGLDVAAERIEHPRLDAPTAGDWRSPGWTPTRVLPSGPARASPQGRDRPPAASTLDITRDALDLLFNPADSGDDHADLVALP